MQPEDDVVGAWRTVRRELATYGHGLGEKREFTALSKSDAVLPRDLAAKKAKLKRACRGPVLTLSGVSGAGVPAALAALLAIIDVTRAEAAFEPLYASRARALPAPAVSSSRSARRSSSMTAAAI